jgi:hypothetical protein
VTVDEVDPLRLSKAGPQKLDGVRGELPIRGNEPEPVELSLSHQDAIEWVSVVRRHLREMKHVSQLDSRGPVSECCRSFWDVFGGRQRQAQLAEGMLDDDLPCACGRERSRARRYGERPGPRRLASRVRAGIKASSACRPAASLVVLEGAAHVVG